MYRTHLVAGTDSARAGAAREATGPVGGSPARRCGQEAPDAVVAGRARRPEPWSTRARTGSRPVVGTCPTNARAAHDVTPGDPFLRRRVRDLRLLPAQVR